MILTYETMAPKIHETVFIGQNVNIIGDVTIGSDSNIWYNSVIRGDVAPV
ncbi:MAG: gamma carbonic anhydrase family protein, partial [Alphaproteobacteria bacterium]|nr:gamma carbonic anhydrase family protein [Alphaproteobacteria bacterium]